MGVAPGVLRSAARGQHDERVSGTGTSARGAAPLDGGAVQRAAAEVAIDLPAVTLTRPFGPEHDVYKVAGKVFCMATEATGQPLVTLKCDPEHSVALRQQFPSITPGYHVNKRHWISVAAGPGITPDLVEELVLEAYALVVEGMPRHARPAVPDAVSRAPRRARAQGADPSGR